MRQVEAVEAAVACRGVRLSSSWGRSLTVQSHCSPTAVPPQSHCWVRSPPVPLHSPCCLLSLFSPPAVPLLGVVWGFPSSPTPTPLPSIAITTTTVSAFLVRPPAGYPYA